MRWHISCLFAVGLVLLMTSTLSYGQTDKKDTPDAKSPNYYPLQVDNAWRYKVTHAGKPVEYIARVTKIEMVSGQEVARLESSVGSNVSEHLLQTSDGVFRYRHNGVDITPPICLVKYPIKGDAKWAGDIMVDTDKGKYSCEAKEEAIEVPAGKFQAVRVTLRSENSKGKSATTTYWFADGVGLVKQTFDADGEPVVVELQKFERTKQKEKQKK
jgi:hypothetical protein